MDPLQRRFFLSAAGLIGAAGAAHAATFGNPDRPAEGAINARLPSSTSEPGPKNPAIASQFPDFQNPPATDINGLPLFWASFNNAHKRIQNGGWAREVNQEDFSISEDISGVNMRLSAGGIREMHWHQQAEWGFVMTGSVRITTLDEMGRASVEDLAPGDLWYFPAGLPHSLQGLGPDGSEFLIIFDNGRSSEFNTLLLTDWIAHTPPEVLAKNFGLPQSSLKNIPVDNLWIFQGETPGPLADDQRAAHADASAQKVVFRLGSSQPYKSTPSGTARIADSRNFHISKTIAAAYETLAPGAIRELHWHPNADEWGLVLQGQARATLFNTGPKAVTSDFKPGDIWYFGKSFGHYIENTGTEEFRVLSIFKSDRFAEVSLNDWLTHVPPSLVRQHLNISEADIARLPQGRPDFRPA